MRIRVAATSTTNLHSQCQLTSPWTLRSLSGLREIWWLSLLPIQGSFRQEEAKTTASTTQELMLPVNSSSSKSKPISRSQWVWLRVSRTSMPARSNRTSSINSRSTKWLQFNNKWQMTSSTSLSPTTSKSPPWIPNHPISRSSVPISSFRDPQPSFSLNSKSKWISQWSFPLSSQISIPSKPISHIRGLVPKEVNSHLTLASSRILIMLATQAVYRNSNNNRLRWLGLLRSNNLRSLRRRSSNRSNSSRLISSLTIALLGNRSRTTTSSLWMTAMQMNSSIRV